MVCSVSTVVMLTEGSDFAMLDCRRVTDGKLSVVDSKPARDSRGETIEIEPPDSCQMKCHHHKLTNNKQICFHVACLTLLLIIYCCSTIITILYLYRYIPCDSPHCRSSLFDGICHKVVSLLASRTWFAKMANIL